MGKRKHKPHDPAAQARMRAEQEGWANFRSNMALPANADVKLEEATRKHVARARRYDCFALLRSRGAISEAGEQAVRRYQEQLAILHKSDGTGPRLEVIDGGGKVGGFTLAQLAARKNIATLKAQMEALSSYAEIGGRKMWVDGAVFVRLLERLVEPGTVLGQQRNWRPIVANTTGEYRDKHQSRWIELTCDCAAVAYQKIDNQPRRAA